MVNELRAVVKELGGRTVLGRNLASQRDLCEAIREGFPPAVVEELLQASGLTLKELAEALDLSPRSLQRRRRSGRLARFESDRLYRLARIIALAQQSLGDRQSAARWLKRSNRALGGASRVLARWRTCWDESPTAESVETSLSRPTQGLRALPARWRGNISLRRPLVQPRHPSRLHFRASIAGHVGILRPSGCRRRPAGSGSGQRRDSR